MSEGREEGLGGVIASKVGMLGVLLTVWEVCELLGKRDSKLWRWKKKALVAGTVTFSNLYFGQLSPVDTNLNHFHHHHR